MLLAFARPVVVLGTALLFTGCTAGALKPGVPAAGDASRITTQSKGPAESRAVCPDRHRRDVVHCLSFLRTDLPPSETPYGYTPTDLQSAYNLPSTTDGAGQTVAIVDAYDDPDAESDLFIYRNYFKLPVCSTLNGCFTKVNQRGNAHDLPAPNKNWAIEISLDLDMVSANCPNCKILLVEATTDSWHNVGQAVNEAVKLGATIVSNSYGGFGGANPKDYSHPGVVIIAGSGDSGFFEEHDQEPAGFSTVVAVGGTTLTGGGTGSRVWTETVWPGTGSGCSKFPKPSWQTGKGCKRRTENDVAAVGDPATGVAAYNSYSWSGWMEIGGTSVGTPLNASVFALAGNASQQNAAQTFYVKQHHQYLNDVTSGSNGKCFPAYLCNGEVGYDAPTGWGTPNGIGAY
jgi:subtilase family serine protease